MYEFSHSFLLSITNCSAATDTYDILGTPLGVRPSGLSCVGCICDRMEGFCLHGLKHYVQSPVPVSELTFGSVHEPVRKQLKFYLRFEWTTEAMRPASTNTSHAMPLNSGGKTTLMSMSAVSLIFSSNPDRVELPMTVSTQSSQVSAV